MRRDPRRALLIVPLLVPLLAVPPPAAGVAAGTTATTTTPTAAPPPVSNLRAVVSDHRAVFTFDVPAAYYAPYARGIARLTVGRTPATSPTSPGYDLWIRNRSVTSFYLNDESAYTLAVWVEVGGRYSARRTLTVVTPTDVTPPHPLARVTAQTDLVDGCEAPEVRLQFTPLVWDPDVAEVRIVRNTVYTTTGGDVFYRLPDNDFIDATGLARHTRYYYWAIPIDHDGHPAPYYVGVNVLTP